MKRNPSPILSVDNLSNAVKNAQKEAVQSVCLSFGNSLYHLENAVIIPQRNHSDLVLFVGAPINKPAATKSFFSFGTKAKAPPLHNQITPAVIATIEQLFNGSDITTKSLNEIKTALSEVNAHFEKLSNAQNPLNSNRFGGAL
jgi:hypothetical protein